jgi:predicted  nucleic acid-binding Zn-ribbon protein
MAREAIEEVKDLKEIGELKLDIRRLEGQRKEACEELGEKAFQLHTAGQLQHEELQEAFDKIESLTRRIESREQEIGKIKEEGKPERPAETEAPEGDQFCSECGGPITPDMKFCSECGAKLKA